MGKIIQLSARCRVQRSVRYVFTRKQCTFHMWCLHEISPGCTAVSPPHHFSWWDLNAQSHLKSHLLLAVFPYFRIIFDIEKTMQLYSVSSERPTRQILQHKRAKKVWAAPSCQNLIDLAGNVRCSQCHCVGTANTERNVANKQVVFLAYYFSKCCRCWRSRNTEKECVQGRRRCPHDPDHTCAIEPANALRMCESMPYCRFYASCYILIATSLHVVY